MDNDADKLAVIDAVKGFAKIDCDSDGTVRFLLVEVVCDARGKVLECRCI